MSGSGGTRVWLAEATGTYSLPSPWSDGVCQLEVMSNVMRISVSVYGDFRCRYMEDGIYIALVCVGEHSLDGWRVEI